MDRKVKHKKISEIVDKISPRDRIYIEMHNQELMYSIIGFVPTSEGTDNSILISHLGYLLSQKGLNTCIVDFKVFNPSLYQYLDCQQNKKGEGLIKILRSDKVDLRDEITTTKYDRLYLLSPSPFDNIEEYFEFDFDCIERTISALKGMFDVVLIDIPNFPALEFCVATMKYCHMGFMTCSERLEAPNNMEKLLDFLTSIGISTSKFTSVIIMNHQNNQYDISTFEKMGFNIVAILPHVKGAVTSYLEGEMYIKTNPILNKHFVANCNRLVELIMRET